MKKFYLRPNKKGKLKWYVKENSKFRKINKKENKELKERIEAFNSIPIFKIPMIEEVY